MNAWSVRTATTKAIKLRLSLEMAPAIGAVFVSGQAKKRPTRSAPASLKY